MDSWLSSGAGASRLFGLSGLSGLFSWTNEREQTDPRTRVLGDNQDQEQIAVILFLTVIESISIAARLIPIASTTRSSTLDSLP